jgi:hypothetical protein
MAIVRRLRPPPINVDANDWAFKKWFNDVYQWSSGGILIPAGLSSTSTASLSPLYPGRRNALINGSFQIWQRGTSHTSTGTTPQYTADRWAISRASSIQVVSRQSGPPGFQYCARIARSAADTSTTSLFLVQALESNIATMLAGQKVTLSFWMRVGSGWDSSVDYLEAKFDMGTGTDEGPFAAHTGASNVITAHIANPEQGGPWRFYQFTATVPSTCTEGKVYFDWSPSSTAAANNYIELAGIQLEIGERASAFDMPVFAEELELCQRFYQKSFPYATTPAQNAGAAGAYTFPCTVAGASSNRVSALRLAPAMRTTPTHTFYNTNAANAFAWNFIRSTSATATSASGSGEGAFGMSVTGIAGWAVNDLCGVNWTADAEL